MLIDGIFEYIRATESISRERNMAQLWQYNDTDEVQFII